MQVEDIKVFIPSLDYQKSVSFYNQLGFTSEYVTDDLTLCKNGECEFFIQRFYNQQLAENLMLQICVSDIEEAYTLAKKSQYKTKLSEIQAESWAKVFYLWGPAGELLHITQLNH
ncbi:lactoylglutathione lyase [Aliiglaciecola sp. 2_MG-2023]|uniref:lactoylglutathione lyase n=1 Tax=Alteromonadaceae TaxID=72275 RepID=UPI0026E266FF|nr:MULTISPECIES: lactoylglutathione lyase [unclassified Aliiglaciecola]MDO6712176.1 lactoylglutathione lyase [Aliiglaciecola sp. 2_MG-2023]MDO6753586.1 lactoylglutathione lyase [Aliiglaciecola sp. 1_MG-2023]